MQRYFAVSGGSILAKNNPTDAPQRPSFLLSGASE
eukprot:SAG11_NODE_230_length_11943_cov_73.442962_2_plen_35_part_00